jgi:imidazolonepropionase-like amidohydrolase
MHGPFLLWLAPRPRAAPWKRRNSKEQAVVKVILCAIALFSMTQTARAETVFINAGHIITDPAKPVLGPSTIRVDDAKIVSITPGFARAEPGKKIIDLSTKTVLSGLIDMHVHLSSEPGGDFRDDAVYPDEWGVAVGVKNARTTVLSGFTTVRDLGSAPRVGFVLRDGTAKGMFVGPRIIAAGPALSIIGGHGDVSGFRPEVNAVLNGQNTCTGAEQCAARVREAAKNGADLIKITATGGVLSQQGRGLGQHFTDAEMGAIVTTAHSLGLRVAAHAHGARGIEAAARAGVDSIEHGTFADLAALKVMKANGTAFVPTLMAFTGIRDRLGKGVYTPTVEAKVRETLSQVGKALHTAHDMGITIVFGTDAAVFEHGRNAEEFGQMVDLGGLTPAEAIASATTSAARLLDMEGQIGRVAPGYSADMIAVDGDPLTNVRVLEKVTFVMVRGQVVK